MKKFLINHEGKSEDEGEDVSVGVHVLVISLRIFLRISSLSIALGLNGRMLCVIFSSIFLFRHICCRHL